MKKLEKSLMISLIFVFFMFNIIYGKVCFQSVLASGGASSEAVMERDSLRVLHESSGNKKLPMASTTKIATAITVIESADITKPVTIPAEACNIEGSSIYLKAGEVLTVEALLYGLMLRSGNDAACALALFVGKTIENFAQMMNDLAVKCGATGTHFSNPHGLSDDDHYTTAVDLARITCYALKNPVFAKIVSTKKITFGERTFVNKNKMLYRYDGADGVKTGYTVNAGRCLVTSATKNGMQLVSVVLNTPDMYKRSEELLDEAFGSYSLKTVVKSGQLLGKVKVSNSPVIGDEYPVYASCDVVFPLKDVELEKLDLRFLPVTCIDYPVKNSVYLGELSFYIDNDLIFSSGLYTIKETEKSDFSDILNGIFVRWGFYED